MASKESEVVLPIRPEITAESPLTMMLMSKGMAVDEPGRLSRREEFDRLLFITISRYSFVALTICIHAVVFLSGLVYYDTNAIFVMQHSDNGGPLPFAHAAALVLHCDVAVLLLPVCRTLISLLRTNSLHILIQKGNEISYHVAIAWSMTVFAWVHAVAHWVHLAQVASGNNLGFKGFLLLGLSTGSGWSGHIMLIAITLIAATSTGYVRMKSWSTFCAFHHLYGLVFVVWAVHGTFTMSRAENFKSWTTNATFWQFWICGGTAYLLERVLRELRGKRKTNISKVVQHPSDVVEIQMKKRGIAAKVGQVSIWQHRAFVLTNAPEEDYLSIHVRCSDGFTKTLAVSVGCKFSGSRSGSPVTSSSVVSIDEKVSKLHVDPTLRFPLPPISVNGPFGHTPSTLWEKDVAILVSVGPSVTVFASILKSIWYRMNYAYEKTSLRKIYFFWLCEDMVGLEWFKNLIIAIETQNLDDNIEIRPYFTDCYKKAPAKAFIANEDIFAGLRSPTMFGPPNWSAILDAIEKLERPSHLGVLPCSSLELVADLRVACNRCVRRGLKLELREL
ncbi:hypothetical protein ACLMJK_000325 [Lecanora helva]